ncbi:MAG: rRNA maturation RNase YbeY [Lachnospiraceae bacterium]|nr:rRNA maturation RNase YbeY [Lachnospiraceae bacterium]
MALYYEEETPFEVDFDAAAVADAVIGQVADMEEVPYEFDIYVTMVSDEDIHEINKEQRNIDRPTDVLSFPNLDFEVPGDFSLVEENEANYFDPESGMLIMGDIVISVDKVYEQALEYGHSRKREFAFLIAHSMLHLCGYDHMEPEEAAVMEAKQKIALEALGITRED